MILKERRDELKDEKELEEEMEERRSKFGVSIEKLKEEKEELKEADASPMRHSLAIPRSIHELMNKKKNQVVAGEEKLGKTTLITEKQPNLQPPGIVLTPAGGKLRQPIGCPPPAYTFFPDPL